MINIWSKSIVPRIPSCRRLSATIRLYYLEAKFTLPLLQHAQLPVGHSEGPPNGLLSIVVERSSRMPAIYMRRNSTSASLTFPYSQGPESVLRQVSKYMNMVDATTVVEKSFRLWKEMQAIALNLEMCDGRIVQGSMILDDFCPQTWPVYRSQSDADEVEALENLLVYHRKEGDIGNIVNGAGLSMSTLDVLQGRAANFMDCGGKATSQTVAKALEIILRNNKVKAVFVNIFGGLTKGDLIANGVVDAVRQLKVGIPIVVRIRGTNEREGQEIIATSGCGLYPEIELDMAVEKVMILADRGHVAGTRWTRG